MSNHHCDVVDGLYLSHSLSLSIFLSLSLVRSSSQSRSLSPCVCHSEGDENPAHRARLLKYSQWLLDYIASLESRTLDQSYSGPHLRKSMGTTPGRVQSVGSCIFLCVSSMLLVSVVSSRSRLLVLVRVLRLLPSRIYIYIYHISSVSLQNQKTNKKGIWSGGIHSGGGGGGGGDGVDDLLQILESSFEGRKIADAPSLPDSPLGRQFLGIQHALQRLIERWGHMSSPRRLHCVPLFPLTSMLQPVRVCVCVCIVMTPSRTMHDHPPPSHLARRDVCISAGLAGSAHGPLHINRPWR
jgi:hypothetical protein